MTICKALTETAVENWPSDEGQDVYVLNARDYDEVLIPARNLLWKIARSGLVNAAGLEYVAKLIRALEALPAVPDLEVSLTLRGPRRRYGEHEIFHDWSICTESGSGMLEISAGGHFYRRSTGGDSFTSLQWTVFPGGESDFGDFLHTLGVVEDAEPFTVEVDGIDLSLDGYTLDISIDGESVCDSTQDDDGEEGDANDFQDDV